jgi:Cu(I)/Ag(I) efflux system periplasmic protein CusF
MNKILIALSTSLLFVAGAAVAASHPPAAAPTASSADMADGEVRKVDMEARKLTLKHGEIKNLGMPGMTMVFQVKDPSMLEKVKSGDKIRFTAEKINGAFTVTTLEPAK